MELKVGTRVNIIHPAIRDEVFGSCRRQGIEPCCVIAEQNGETHPGRYLVVNESFKKEGDKFVKVWLGEKDIELA